ncbi:sigma-54 dependent transcriptional regulator [Halodesulfovibrio sp.]|jgi:DNA-binding NtrC family response regulator|uniref:sigma-54-dependent transcriptional regulator n=1 Tax=Halodesulfovibrio sp. TaxID=1912772 RepID=UPI0025E3953B|nr:sigma-54 dependent transcriptional regulator [Halodesulfovibrio sp.]MCT4534176.1 sigma-54 dependent transcriptional regulator [Halodesulfovibrio sp.]
MPSNYPRHPLLLVDDEDSWLVSFKTTLRAKGIDNVVTENDSTNLLSRLQSQQFCAIAIDLMMPNISGEELIPQIVAQHPNIPILVVSGLNQVKSAVNCMRLGAFDFIVKTEERDTLIAAVRHAIEMFELRQENTSLRERFFKKELDHPEYFATIITQNKEMHSIFQYIEAIAETSRPVLITGESGVGKELIAKAVHDSSGRTGEFIALNIAGLDDNVVADTLFGHTKGAYTGATTPRMGLVEKAKNGTLFLDEIGDLSLASQTKLLRLLQEHEYRPLGSDMPKRSSARIIAATHQNLTELQENGKFRRDLFYRLRGHLLHIPPLRERREDLPQLIAHFLQEAENNSGKKIRSNPSELAGFLSQYAFPGNIRELQNLIFDCAGSCSSGVLETSHVQRLLTQSYDYQPDGSGSIQIEPSITFGTSLPTVKEVRAALFKEALHRSNNNQSGAAQLIGVTRQAISKFLKEQS